MEDNRKVVKSYNNVWQLNRTFYSIGGMNLPMPVSMNFMLYFLVSEIPMYYLGWLLPSSIRYLLVPGIIAWVFDQKMLDGKGPFQFVRSIAVHYYLVIAKGSQINRFKHYRADHPMIKEKIPYRVHKSKTEALD